MSAEGLQLFPCLQTRWNYYYYFVISFLVCSIVTVEIGSTSTCEKPPFSNLYSRNLWNIYFRNLLNIINQIRYIWKHNSENLSNINKKSFKPKWPKKSLKCRNLSIAENRLYKLLKFNKIFSVLDDLCQGRATPFQ